MSTAHQTRGLPHQEDEGEEEEVVVVEEEDAPEHRLRNAFYSACLRAASVYIKQLH